MDSCSYFFKRTIAQLVVFVVFLVYTIVIFEIGVVFGIVVMITPPS